MSSASSRPPSCSTVSSVIRPAGSITHTARGFSSCPTSCLRPALPAMRSLDERLDGRRIAGQKPRIGDRFASGGERCYRPCDPSRSSQAASVVSRCLLFQRLPNGVLEGRQPRRDMRPEMHAQHPPIALGQYVKIATRFCRHDHAEGVLLIRHLDIRRVVAGNLQEHSGVRAALVGLPRRMKESRTEAETGGDPLAVADQDTDILQCVAMALVAFDIGEERAIVAFANASEVCR